MSHWNSSYYRRGNYNRGRKGSVDSIVNSIRFLPVEAEICPVFLESINQSNESPEALTKFIALSPSLTFNLINLVHSPFYSCPQTISSLDNVLKIIGVDISINLIKDFLIRTLTTQKTGIEETYTNSVFYNSLKSAHLSALIADSINYPSPFIAYVSSLLHNVGETLLSSRFPLQYRRLMPDVKFDYPGQVSAEDQAFGMNHCFLGARMVESWSSFPFISDAIFYHHHPLEKIKQASKLVKLVYFSSIADIKDEKSRSGLIEAGKELFKFSDNQIDEYISIAELKAQNRMLNLGIEILDSNSEAIYQPKSSREIEYLHETGSNSLLSVLIDLVRKSESKKALFSNIGKAIHILTGINEIYYFKNNEENKSLDGFRLGQIENNAVSDDLSVTTDTSKSIIVTSFLMGIDINSFDRVNNTEPAVFDLQLSNYMGSDGLYCLPLVFNDRVFGVIVLGVNVSGRVVDKETVKRLRYFMEALIPFVADDGVQNNAERELHKNGKSNSIQTRKLLHEINNPLSAIKNYLKVLNMKLDDLNVENKEIKIIDNELDRISKLLKEFKTSPSDKKMEKTSSSINSLISDTILLVKNSRMSGPEINIDFEADENIPDVMVDKDALRQVLINLINNAVEAMPMGGKISVSVQYKSGLLHDANLDAGANGIEISIADDGPGLPDNIKSDLFRKQSTTKPDHDGLGLLIVYELIKRMGGTVILDDNDSSGACFRITLPVN